MRVNLTAGFYHAILHQLSFSFRSLAALITLATPQAVRICIPEGPHVLLYPSALRHYLCDHTADKEQK